MKAIAPRDFRDIARARLPRFLFDYIDGGAHAETTLARNVADLEQLLLRQRVCRDVSTVDPATTLFGQKLAVPVVLGPVGMAGMFARRGETQAARAATRAGVPFCLSTVGLCSIEEVTRAAGAPIWFQLYMLRDRGFVGAMLEQAAAQGCPALVFTVDLPMPGTRYRDFRSGLSTEPGPERALRRFAQAFVRPRWAWDVGLRGRPHVLGNVASLLTGKGIADYFVWIRDNFDPSVTWRDLEWVRSRWRGPLILKGILEPDDARAAAQAGADGIVVSNHGGRQLDGAMSSARALPAIADAVGDKVPILVDGGVRSGLDVLRMLGLGARGVMLGRAWAYALGAGGEAGVAQLLQLIDAELRIAMALTGVTRVAAVDRTILAGVDA